MEPSKAVSTFREMDRRRPKLDPHSDPTAFVGGSTHGRSCQPKRLHQGVHRGLCRRRCLCGRARGARDRSQRTGTYRRHRGRLSRRPGSQFNLNLLPYKFRWWYPYSSQMANWGAHYLDAMRWCARETARSSISAHGGIYAVHDCRSIPDTAEVIFEHASGLLTIFSTFEASGQPLLRSGEIELRGTLGCTPGEDRAGHESAARLGRPVRAIHEQRVRQRTARLRISPAMDARDLSS